MNTIKLIKISIKVSVVSVVLILLYVFFPQSKTITSIECLSHPPLVSNCRINTFTDKLTPEEIRLLYHYSLNRLTFSYGPAEHYYYQDIMGWPRLKSVWQFKHEYIVLRLSENNDNDALWWSKENGNYDKGIDNATGVTLKEINLPGRAGP